ncbi:isopeptide-forming domain-containing fimbrial protein [Companilactobacillus sp. HBUAS56275]|uniref:Isopeptide-forming domain-containing fimbrial protein n=1 Tax=Candidatus Companilactobacillus pullicola TaxID=2838523 RepID=A0A9D2CP88_9LACO|nr:isopeptide-forming domain-containing fimbrial protein [Candidatus Companilactobacillus pullicola]
MINKYKYIRGILVAFFAVFICIIAFSNNTLTVKAATTQNVIDNTNKIDDGYSNWVPATSNRGLVGSIPISASNNVSLDYTFGSARNSSGNVTSGDDTITTGASNIGLNTGYGSGYSYYSKINVFINNNGKYYSILHQGQNSYINGSPQKTSDSSFDYALVTGTYGSTANYYSSQALMVKMDQKVLMHTTDSNGRLVLKIAGYLTGTAAAGAYAEVVLRPSSTGAPVVQRELYVYSPNKKVQFQPYFGEDTAMNEDSRIYDSSTNTNVDAIGDDVPLFAIGGGQGLYINNAKNTNSSKSKLFVTNNVPGGFENFMGIAFSSSYSPDIKGKPLSANAGSVLTPNLKPGGSDPGDTDKKAGQPLLFAKTQYGGSDLIAIVDADGRQNSAYTLRWPYQTLDTGATGHYSSTIGATVSPYAVPIVTKTYTNSNQNSDGTNNVGDTLHFKLKVVNNGLNSHWNLSKIVDSLPKGLQINPNTINYTVTHAVPSSDTGSNEHDIDQVVDSGFIPSSSVSGNKFEFEPNTVIPDKGTYTVNLNATVTFDAAGTGSLTNTASFSGNNQTSSGVALDTTTDYTDQVKIPIRNPNLNISFDKKLRNVTKNTNFSNTESGSKGDIIEYQTTIHPTGTDTIKSATFNDTLPDGIKLVPGSITVNGVKQSYNTDIDGLKLGAIASGSSVPIVFQAKVTSPLELTATNIAVLNNIQTASGKTYNNRLSTAAILNISATAPTMQFEKVPSSIEFGTINSTGSERVLPNIRTDGLLVIDHTSDNPFQITVGYDNNGGGSIVNQKDKTTKLIQDNNDAIYLNQANDANKENWVPLSTGGIPIKSEGFSGSYTGENFTKYVDLGKWKLRVPGTASAGQYSGTITWGMQDTPQ